MDTAVVRQLQAWPLGSPPAQGGRWPRAVRAGMGEAQANDGAVLGGSPGSCETLRPQTHLGRSASPGGEDGAPGMPIKTCALALPFMFLSSCLEPLGNLPILSFSPAHLRLPQ